MEKALRFLGAPACGNGCGPKTPSGLKLPTFAELAADKLLGGRGIFGLHVGAVPLQFLSGAHGDIAQENDLRQVRRDVEIRIGGRAALDGRNPFKVMSLVGVGIESVARNRLWDVLDRLVLHPKI